MTLEGYEGHFEHFEGGYSVGFEFHPTDELERLMAVVEKNMEANS
jgi:hypothetical protein